MVSLDASLIANRLYYETDKDVSFWMFTYLEYL